MILTAARLNTSGLNSTFNTLPELDLMISVHFLVASPTAALSLLEVKPVGVKSKSIIKYDLTPDLTSFFQTKTSHTNWISDIN